MPDRGAHPESDAGGGPSAAGERRVLQFSPETHLAAIVESSDDAILSKSPTGEILSWNSAARNLYGYTEDEVVGKSIAILIPPERAGEEQEILRRIMAGERIDHYETERMRKDGGRLAISLTISPVRDGSGAIVGASVIAHDITEQKRAQERTARLHAVTAALTRALSSQEIVDVAIGAALPALSADAATVALVSDDGRTLELAGSMGYSAKALQGWQRFPVDADLPLSEAVRTKEPVWTDSAESLAGRYPALAQSSLRFASLAAVPLIAQGRTIGGMALSFRRVHEFTSEDRSFILSVAQQTASALDRGRLYEREQRARATAERAGDRLAFLSRASRILAESLELDEILQRIADVAVPRIADWCGVDLVAENDEIRQVAIAHVDPAKVELARELRRRYPTGPDSPTGVPAVIRTGQPEVYPEITDAMLVESAQDEEHLRVIRALEIGSVMIVPLSARGRTLGAVTFVTSDSERSYGDEDLAFAEDLARRAALAVDNSLLYREEHHAAVTLQRSLLPDSLPEMAGLELAARYRPAGRGIEVGGDWYDALRLGEQLVVVVGDVAGRGIEAASVMGQLRNALRAYAFEGQSPAQALERLNRLATASEGAEMATLLYVVIDPGSGRLEYVRAGHPPALVRQPDGTVIRLEDRGSPPLGVSQGSVYRSGSHALAEGSLVLLYTDGLIERRDKPIEAQLDRLENALRDSPSDLQECCDFLLRAMEVDDEAGDDTALLVLRVEITPRDRFRLELPAEVEGLRRVRRELALWLDASGVDRQEAHAIVTACNEACANAVEHAYGVHEAGAIHVEAALEGEEMVISVRDFGVWREAGSSRARSEADRGRGFMLMNGLTDHVDVSPGTKGTNVVIRHRLAERAAA
jgi:PAS domain S-box-containing protein